MKHSVPTSCFSALVSLSSIEFTDILMLTADKGISVLDEALHPIQLMKSLKYPSQFNDSVLPECVVKMGGDNSTGSTG